MHLPILGLCSTSSLLALQGLALQESPGVASGSIVEQPDVSLVEPEIDQLFSSLLPIYVFCIP
jgi:hypothetical protein